MEKNDVYLYRNSLEYARRSNEVALWRASYHANLACKEAIEAAIRQGFDGAHLSDDCVHGVLEQFGFKRVGWVLSNTIQQLYDDGRFRPANRAWAEETYIPRDEQHNLDFVVTSHPEVLNGFVTQYRNAYQALGLFSTGDCLPNSFEELDYTAAGVLLVSGKPALVCPRRIRLRPPRHRALRPLHLPGRRRGNPVEPDGLPGGAEGGTAAGLGQGEAGRPAGAKGSPAGADRPSHEVMPCRTTTS